MTGAKLLWRGLSALLLCIGCSSIAPDLGPQRCEDSSDCSEDSRCNLDQGVCVSKRLPHRPTFALRARMSAPIQSSSPGLVAPASMQLSFEVKGCELDAFDIHTGLMHLNLANKLRPIRLSHLTQSRHAPNFCAADCSPYELCEPATQSCGTLRSGNLRLAAPSRLQGAWLETSVSLATELLPDPKIPYLDLWWPCTSSALSLHEQAQWTQRDLETPGQRAPDHYRILRAPTCASAPLGADRGPRFALQQGPGCQLALDLSWASEIQERANFDLVLRYPESRAKALVVLSDFQYPGAIPCQDDALCRAKLGPQAGCGSQGRCGLDLRGKKAGTLYARSSTGDAGQSLVARVPCPFPPPRSLAPFRLELVPANGVPSAQRLAPMHWEIPVALDTAPTTTRAQRLCLPFWQRAGQLELGGVGAQPSWHEHAPFPLLPGRMACSAEDLNHPVAQARCSSPARTTLTLHADAPRPGKRAAPDCLAPQGPRTLTLSPSCDRSPCRVDLWSPSDHDCVRASVDLVREPSSLFASLRKTLPATLCPGDGPLRADLGEIWEPRPVLRGRLHESSGQAPAVLDAIVMAERLRDGEQDPIGPYFFHQRVVAKGPHRGQFALPVQAGRYVVTAMALAPGTPQIAPFRVVDARNQTSFKDPRTQLTLTPGAEVRVQLDRNEREGDLHVQPLDIGSWTDDPTIPDLNDPKTCYPTDRGCLIRMLTPPVRGAPTEISPDHRSVMRWRSRLSGPAACRSSAG